MENIDVSSQLSQFEVWLSANKNLLIDYSINLVIAFIILLIGFFIARIVHRLVMRVLNARSVDKTVSQFVASLARYAIIVFTIIAALSHVGVQTASVIAVLGAAGLAVGLALQGSLSNFAAGVILVTFRPFRAGEFVTFGSVSGTVTSIHIFSTTLDTVDGKMVVVPNSKVIASEIINFSRDPNRRVDITVGVGYEADIDAVKRVLGEVVEKDSRILTSLGVTIRLNEMAASSLNFVVRVWVKNGDFANVYFDLMEGFKRALDANQISIPYPQMDVHVRTPAAGQ
ncbi:mechanosensitive ion channel protein MscS [Leminorella grimontii]|uniref:Small-conductance mechanosensitive channel n=1 Tax=Leminorella grimontii TaxID=82981 RepID=A0AAV5N6X3_9GAMM|nr:small-conductance mechanosensitive channel MscS [Leminorella grimontii]KFC98213.1 mechanosensitive channel stability protein [Leminorella grimontii ATCC 33999 = DSM 5078]GKX57504.1 mechanosensitive ion channel protein MscS [Leminorella grimontii]VFS56131.1 Small-conductance mechanosensitive channel [Leminorella grimontii]